MNGKTATTTEQALLASDAALPVEPRPAAKAAVGGPRGESLWSRIDRLLSHAGDWLNPILVKETRQALKSFQFTITFVLVLVACWVVTIGGVAVIGPRIFYSADGGFLLFWYYAVLAFPLTVVVPYAAFRSLASEREDNTYDLLSITALRPRQIISGKLGSALVQMGVYFSAITPCVAFTYLLRGVDLPTIALLLTYMFFQSLGLSMLGILLATISQQRFTQVFISVALVAVLIWVFLMSLTLTASGVIRYNYRYWGGSEFWIFVSAAATTYATFFALAFFAASGMITFTSENRSTPLRICMLLQQAAWIGWMAYAWLNWENLNATILLTATISAIYWYVMGTMLASERAGMSQRVKRRLPSSFLGRMFFSWLNPGPASGYMFVIANATTIALVCLLAMIAPAMGGRTATNSLAVLELLYLLIIGWGYLVAYLGLGMLVVALVRRVAVVTMLASVLIHFLVLLAGSGIPTAIQLMSIELRFVEYSLLQITNPIWSLKYLAEGGLPSEAHILVMVIPAAAVCILMLNMRSVVRELREVRIAPPSRVVEDEAQLHPVAASLPANPWEEPD